MNSSKRTPRGFSGRVAEANMMGIAAGLHRGKNPLEPLQTSPLDVFMTNQAVYRVSGKNVKICASHAGVTR